MSWCREDSHTHPLPLQDTPFCRSSPRIPWDLFILYGTHQILALMVSFSFSVGFAASPCELFSEFLSSPPELERAALCGWRSRLKAHFERKNGEGGRNKNWENYIVKWDICRWACILMSLLPGWLCRAGRHGRAGALWHPSPAQWGLWILPESRNLKSKGKNLEKQGPFVSFTLIQDRALLHASLSSLSSCF